MKLLKSIALLLFTAIIVQSCYVTHPRYSTVDQVMTLEVGMPLDTVHKILEQGPYDLVSRNDTGATVYLYKYRVKNIRRVPRTTHHNKGLEKEGRFRELLLTVDSTNVVTHIQTQPEPKDSHVKEKKIDVASIINTATTIITVTIPSLLVYLSVN